VRMGAVVGGGQEGEEDEELRQTKEQAAARRRWETLVRFLHLVCGLLILFAVQISPEVSFQKKKSPEVTLSSKLQGCRIVFVLFCLF